MNERRDEGQPRPIPAGRTGGRAAGGPGGGLDRGPAPRTDHADSTDGGLTPGAAPGHPHERRPEAQYRGGTADPGHLRTGDHGPPASPAYREPLAHGPVTETDRRQDHELRSRVDQHNHIVMRGIQVVDYLFYLLYALLGMRFVLTLLGASETAGFVQFVNGITQPFYGPFSGIVSRPSVNGGALDFPLIIALLAYVVLHIAIRGLLRLLMSSDRNAVRR
jgi:uncharacterized protein YggT (Ycf19 family)